MNTSLKTSNGPVNTLIFLVVFGIIRFKLHFNLVQCNCGTKAGTVDSLGRGAGGISRTTSVINLAIMNKLVTSFIRLGTGLIVRTNGTRVTLRRSLLSGVVPGVLPLNCALLVCCLLGENLSPIVLVLVAIIVNVVNGVPFPFNAVLWAKIEEGGGRQFGYFET